MDNYRQHDRSSSGNRNHDPRRNAHKQIDNELLSYLEHVQQLFDKNEFEDDEERDILINNVFSEMRGKEFNLAMHHRVSRIVEKLMPAFPLSYLRLFFYRLGDKILQLCFSCSGSHIVEQLLRLLLSKLSQDGNTSSSSSSFFEDRSGTSSSSFDHQEEYDESYEANNERGVEEEAYNAPSAEQLILRFAQQVFANWGDLITDNYASHVVRTLFYTLRGRLPPSPSSPSHSASTEEEKQKQKQLTSFRVPKTFRAKLVEIVEDMLRAGPDADYNVVGLCFEPSACLVFQVIVDVLVDDDKDENEEEEEEESNELKLSDLRARFVARALKMEESDDDKKNKKNDSGKQKEEDAMVTAQKAHVRSMVKNNIASHLVEKILETSSTELYTKLYTTHFRGQLMALCCDNVSNFVIQQLIASAHNAVHLQLIFQEFYENNTSFKQLFGMGRGGVILKLVEGYAKSKAVGEDERKKLVKFLIESVTQISSPHNKSTKDEEEEEEEGQKKQKKQKKGNSFEVKALLELSSSFGDGGRREQNRGNQNFNNKKKRKGRGAPASAYSSVGCLIVKSLFSFPFNYVNVVINSFAKLDKEYLLTMAKDVIGSRVVEAFLVETSSAPPKKKLQVAEAFAGYFAELAAHKYGSHIVDSCYRNTTVEIKEMIAKELLAAEKELDKEHYGRMVLYNCKIGQYKLKQDVWLQNVAASQRKRQMFADILTEAAEAEAEATAKAEEEKEQNSKASAVNKKTKNQTKEKKATKKKPAADDMMSVLGFSHKEKASSNGRDEKKRKRKRAAADEQEEEEDDQESLNFIMDAIAATKQTTSEKEATNEAKKKQTKKPKKPTKKQKKAKAQQ
ncbi:hypothetical protein QOT17_012056 [Balamuthia mandrillaris]